MYEYTPYNTSLFSILYLIVSYHNIKSFASGYNNGIDKQNMNLFFNKIFSLNSFHWDNVSKLYQFFNLPQYGIEHPFHRDDEEGANIWDMCGVVSVSSDVLHVSNR